MIIGILYEGKNDRKALQKIITKIITEKKPENTSKIKFITKEAGGTILGYIVEAASLFFQANKCDIGIFVSDVDEDKKLGFKKVSSIKTKCKKHITSEYPDAKYVLAFPKPELEDWFFIEEHSLRNFFNIPEEEPIKYRSYPSKERLQKLINDFASVVYTPEDIYEKIAEGINLDQLKVDKDFKKFSDDLEKLI